MCVCVCACDARCRFVRRRCLSSERRSICPSSPPRTTQVCVVCDRRLFVPAVGARSCDIFVCDCRPVRRSCERSKSADCGARQSFVIVIHHSGAARAIAPSRSRSRGGGGGGSIERVVESDGAERVTRDIDRCGVCVCVCVYVASYCFLSQRLNIRSVVGRFVGRSVGDKSSNSACSTYRCVRRRRRRSR